jgi:hypothetical protein
MQRLPRFWKHWRGFAALAVVVGLATAWYLTRDTIAGGTAQPAAWRSIHIGMSEEQIRSILGTPTEWIPSNSNPNSGHNCWGIRGPKGYRYIEVVWGPGRQAVIVQEYRSYHASEASFIVRSESIVAHSAAPKPRGDPERANLVWRIDHLQSRRKALDALVRQQQERAQYWKKLQDGVQTISLRAAKGQKWAASEGLPGRAPQEVDDEIARFRKSLGPEPPHMVSTQYADSPGSEIQLQLELLRAEEALREFDAK